MKSLTLSLLLVASNLTANSNLTLIPTVQSINSFGASCGPTGPQLSGHGSPIPGGALELQLISASPNAPHLLALGFSDATWAGGALPWVIPPGIGFAPGCAVATSMEVTVPFAVDAAGDGRLAVPIAASTLPVSVYFQAFGLPATGEPYATNGVAVSVVAGVGVTVSGSVVATSTSAPVGGARVTLFTPGLALFHEVRSDGGGNFSFGGVGPGVYRVGVAARGFEYRERDLVVPAGGVAVPFSLSPETHPGQWNVIGTTAPITLDATDIGTLMPSGEIFYCHDTMDPVVFDPVTSAKYAPPSSGSAQGCMNISLLEDGSVIEVGGQDGADPGSFRNASNRVKTWSPQNGWIQQADLLAPAGRWYPGLARLANGDLLVMGGGTRPSAVRTNTCEIFRQATGTWQATGSMGQAVEFPPSALLYTGAVLRTWGAPELYDPATGAWTPAGGFVAPNRGYPGHSDHSMLVLSDGRALAIGINTNSAGANAEMAEVYDPSTGSWSALSSPALKRMQTEVTYLPDGKVLVAGGDEQNLPTTEPQLFDIVKWTDIYDPATDTWRRVANMLFFREYHAVTVLVPDGRVVTAGGTKIKFQNVPVYPDIEAFSPPYLFRGVRPRISNLSTTTPQRGATIAFDVFPATQLTSVVLLGTNAHTHWVDGGVRRRLELPVQQVGSSVNVTLPTDPNVVPVGHYLLFGMVDDIPSVARIVRVRA